MDLGLPVFYHDLRDPDVEPSPLAIVGGGGLFDGGQLESCLQDVLERHGDVVLWGAGLNRPRNYEERYYPDWMNRFTLAGVRDWGGGIEERWVPCPSCMHPGLDIAGDPKEEFVVYNHCETYFVIDYENAAKSRATKGALTAEQNTNTSFSTMAGALKFLSKGKTVLTTSYHGAYWGMLLGRDVIVQGGHSMRFDRMRPEPVVFGDDDAWVHYYASGTTRFRERDALTVCRQVNLTFRDDVRMLVKALS
jgi:hypothetical protein